MKKSYSVLFALTALLLVASLTGCKSPGHEGKNWSGVQGSTGGMGEFDIDSNSNIGLTDRFPGGGTEYPGMFEPVYFAYDSDQVASAERTKIEAVADLLKQENVKCLIIDGHCDNRGSIVYNQNLSEKRALAIRSYLVSLGIESDRIQTRGYGEELPAASGNSEAAWNKNRRGEFVLYY